MAAAAARARVAGVQALQGLLSRKGAAEARGVVRHLRSACRAVAADLVRAFALAPTWLVRQRVSMAVAPVRYQDLVERTAWDQVRTKALVLDERVHSVAQAHQGQWVAMLLRPISGSQAPG
jgi:hypothetical protein